MSLCQCQGVCRLLCYSMTCLLSVCVLCVPVRLGVSVFSLGFCRCCSAVSLVYMYVTVLSLSSLCPSLCLLSLCFVAVSLSLTLCLPITVSWSLSLCLLQCVSVTGFCVSVYVSDTLGLPISVPVCHRVCPPMCHHLPRCHPVCYSPPRPQVGVSGPLVPRAGAQPIPPSLCHGPGWAPVCNDCPR